MRLPKIETMLFTFVIIIFSLFCLITPNENYLLNWLGILIYLYAIFTWHWEKSESLFSLYTIFFSFFLIFSYGQCVMWAFGINLDRGIGSGELYYGSGVAPSIDDLIAAKWYTCLSMLSFHIGALLFARRNYKTNKISWYESGNPDRDRKFLFSIGRLISVIVVPIVLFQKVMEVVIAFMYGYNALYYGDMSMQGGYIQIISFLFFPALICLLVGSGFSKRHTYIVFGIFGVYMMLGLLSGDRGSWLYSLVVLIWLLMRNKNALKWKKILPYFIVAIIGIYMLNVITSVRDGGGLQSLTGEDFLTAFDVEESPIVDAFFEMGGSMGIITYFLTVGNDIYPYANTYLTAILGAVSSRALSLFGLKGILIADWFSQEYLG